MSREGNQFKEAGRFTKSPAPELINSAFTMEVNEGTLLYHGMSLADLAHAVMLIEIGIVPQESRVELLNALIEMHNLSAEEIDFDSEGSASLSYRGGFICSVFEVPREEIFLNDEVDADDEEEEEDSDGNIIKRRNQKPKPTGEFLEREEEFDIVLVEFVELNKNKTGDNDNDGGSSSSTTIETAVKNTNTNTNTNRHAHKHKHTHTTQTNTHKNKHKHTNTN